MKKSMLLAVATVLLFSTAAWAAMQIKDGFHGVKWASKITEQKKFTKVRTSGVMEYYVDHETDYTMPGGGAPDVVFGALGGKLYAVYITLKQEKGYNRAKDYLLANFGNPKVKQEKDVQVYSWKHEHVKIKLKKGADATDMKLAFYYLPLVNPGGADFQQKVEKFPEGPFRVVELPMRTDNPVRSPSAIPLLSF